MTTIHPGFQNGEKPIYLDYNATTPIDPTVVDAMLPYLTTHFGNPSSTHYYGHETQKAVRTAREHVAYLLGAAADEIVFTGGGSESDNLAIRGVTLAKRAEGNHIITQVTEHPAVIKTCQALERLHGVHVTYLPVDQFGRVNPQDVQKAIDAQTVLVSIMHANNETGTLQPIAQIAEIAHRHGVLLHSDASQSVGKIPTRIADLGVDLLTIAGHKLYAPKGIGALFVRRGVELESLIYGGGQESGQRAGTENIAYIVALGTAALVAQDQLPTSMQQMRQLRDLLHQRLDEYLPGSVHLNGHETDRLPNTLNISIDRVIGEEVLAATPTIASSTGSACHEGNTEPSEVLMAMGFSRERALGALRLTLGRWSTREEIERTARLLAKTVDSQRHTM
jgi:cysteine desulfurase